MDIERIKAEVAEHRKIVKALHQYMESQGIARREWGLIFAKAAGYEVYNIVQGRNLLASDSGSMILSTAVFSWASEDRLNVK